MRVRFRREKPLLAQSRAGDPGCEEAYGAESAAAEKAAAVQERTSLLPDYNFAGSDSAAGTSVSGLVGCALVAALAAIISLAGRAARKRSGKKQASAG